MVRIKYLTFEKNQKAVYYADVDIEIKIFEVTHGNQRTIQSPTKRGLESEINLLPEKIRSNYWPRNDKMHVEIKVIERGRVTYREYLEELENDTSDRDIADYMTDSMWGLK